MIGDRWALFTLPAPEPGRTGLLIHSARRTERDILWPGAEMAGMLIRARKGEEAERYRVLRVRTPAGTIPAAVLPARR